jgi:tetratricopeptide (TPR) repeat protein
VASVVGRWLGLSTETVKSLIPIGTAAAVAAAFNTPLAAVLFTLEEILADLNARVVGTVVIGAATAWLVLRLILGDEPLFHVPAYQLVHPLELVVYALLGLAGGVMGAGFVKAMLWVRQWSLRAPGRWKALTPGVGGLVVGALSLVAPGVLGVGYHLMGEALNGHMALRMMVVLLVLKLVATAVCYGTGNAGGVFGPSLFFGAMLGGAVGHVAHAWFPDQTGNAGAYALVGMGVAFASIIRTPMTSVIIIFELTRDYTIIVPLMIANLCSYLVARRLQPATLYAALTKQDGIILPNEAERPRPLTVERAMRPGGTQLATSVTVFPDDPLDMAMQAMGRNGLLEAPVVSRSGGRVLGVVGQEDVLRAYRELAREVSVKAAPALPRQNGLLVVGAITLAAVVIFAGSVFWLRTQRYERGAEAFARGRTLLEQGRADEAVVAFRKGLAQTPQNAELRAALGLALVETGNVTEAAGYLEQAAKEIPHRGPVWMGLAKVAEAAGDRPRTLRLYRQALTREWEAGEERTRWNTQFAYAKLLGKEGVPQLLMLVQQRGDDPVLAKQAADAVKEVGEKGQVKEVMEELTRLFPGDSGAWRRLAEARVEVGDEEGGLVAYHKAAELDPVNGELQGLVAELEEVRGLDPTRRRLSTRERARRWVRVLERLVERLESCGADVDLAPARGLLRQKRMSLETVDQMQTVAVELWGRTNCREDRVLGRVFAKIPE